MSTRRLPVPALAGVGLVVLAVVVGLLIFLGLRDGGDQTARPADQTVGVEEPEDDGPPVVVVLGDDYSGVAEQEDAWPQQVAREVGLDLRLEPGGEVGYVVGGDEAMPERAVAVAERFRPDLVVLAVGAADVAAGTPAAEVEAAVTASLEALAGAETEVLALGPFSPGSPSAETMAVLEAVQTACDEVEYCTSANPTDWLAADDLAGNGRPTAAGQQFVADQMSQILTFYFDNA